MPEDTATLAELMLAAEVFCADVEAALLRQPKTLDQEETRLKISQCRGALSELQTMYETDRLTIADGSVRANFRYLVMSLLWVSFRAGPLVDFKLFRKLLQIESGFTFLLNDYCSTRAGEEPR